MISVYCHSKHGVVFSEDAESWCTIMAGCSRSFTAFRKTALPSWEHELVSGIMPFYRVKELAMTGLFQCNCCYCGLEQIHPELMWRFNLGLTFIFLKFCFENRRFYGFRFYELLTILLCGETCEKILFSDPDFRGLALVTANIRLA